MTRLIYFFALFFIFSQPLLAQNAGEPVTIELSGSSTVLMLDFSSNDYELILYSLKTGETDYYRRFNFVVTGDFSASKPTVREAGRHARPATRTARDRLEYQLRRDDSAIARRLQETGGYRPVRPAAKAVQQQIGSTRQYVFSFGNAETPITAVLVATSAHAHGYVDINDTTYVTAQKIQPHLDHFSNTAYPLATSVFGAESDVDNDGKVHFLYTYLVDYAGSGSGDVHPSHNVSGIAGFYTIRSVLPQYQGGNGNMADLMYLSPTIPSASYYEALLAHEFQHLISCNQHVLLRNGRCEESWLNEAMSHVCEDLVDRHYEGGNISLVDQYLYAPYNYSLTGPATFNTGVRGAAYLFVRSLMEDFGSDILSPLVQTANTGIRNVEAATGQAFVPTFERHLSRLFLSGTGLNPTYAYTPSFLQTSTGLVEFSISAETPSVRLDIRPLSPAYLRLKGNQPHTTITIQTDAAGVFGAQLIPIPRVVSPDFDGDGRVGFSDFLAFSNAYGTHAGQANFNAKFDLDRDGRVGFSDFLIFSNAYGKSVSG